MGAVVGAVFAQAELVLIATIAELGRKLAVGTLLPTIAQRRLTATVRTVLAAATAKAHTASGSASVDIAEMLAQAGATAEADAQQALAAIVAAVETVEAPTARRNVFAAYQHAAERAYLRPNMTSGPLSLERVRAAQQALDVLAARGITGFVDRSGRRWGLAAYVEMATRTAVSNAWDAAHADALVRAGVDLVVVGTHSTEGSCAQCRPWLGRTLSLTGATESFPTMAAAKAAGFRHPNCRCSWAPVGARAAAALYRPQDIARAARVYEATQRRQAQERRARSARRHAAAAITPAARARARDAMRKTVPRSGR